MSNEQESTKVVGSTKKPTHIKPSLYAYHYLELKEIAKDAGWNLLLHGSMNRDLDLLLVPWAQEVTKSHQQLIEEFAKLLGGWVMEEKDWEREAFAAAFHGRLNYVINLNRSLPAKGDGWGEDPQFYLDISVIPLNYKK